MKTGDTKLNAQDRLENFLAGINRYIEAKNLGPTEFNDEFRIAEQMSLKDMDGLTTDECFNYAYMLYQYADHINHEKSLQDTVINWCKSSLMTIISQESENFSSDWVKYTKYEMKEATIIQENIVARKIHDWRDVAEARVASLKNKEYTVRKKADCLIEKGKRL
tara:strand:+ start:2218 stop:2709 length:492 start_codon:yes stop_codon:yes gene_type:complete